jgi:gliding motility-associated-like protein
MNVRPLLLILSFLFPTLGKTQTPTFDWAVQCGNTSADKTLDVATDVNGNLYACGFFNGNGTFGNIQLTPNSGNKDAFVARLDSSGNFLWAISANSGLDDRTLGLCTDHDGNVIATGTYWANITFGTTTLTGSADHPFVIKLDPMGNYIWAIQGGSSGDDHGFDVAVDPQNDIMITGYMSDHYWWAANTGVFGNIPPFPVIDSVAFVAKISSGGTWMWVETFGGTDVERDNDLVVDAAGNVYVAGGFYGTKTFGNTTLTSINGSRDIFVVKYDNAGNFQWVVTTGDSLDDRANGICIDAQQHMYITGEFRDKVPFGSDTLNNHGGPSGRDIFVAMMDTSGNWHWAKRAGSNGGGDVGRAITVNHLGNIFVTGQCKGTVHFGNDTTFATGADSIQVFVAGMDTLGDWKWAMQGGGPLEDRGYGIAVDSSCRLYACGYFDIPSASFFPHSLSAYGRKDGFILRVNNGCFDYNQVPPPDSIPFCDVYLPNVFTPNADMRNDELMMHDPQCIQQMTWTIYNRWGERVTSIADPNKAWDGKDQSGNPVSDGTYYYVLTGAYTNGEPINLTGFFTIIR